MDCCTNNYIKYAWGHKTRSTVCQVDEFTAGNILDHFALFNCLILLYLIVLLHTAILLCKPIKLTKLKKVIYMYVCKFNMFKKGQKPRTWGNNNGEVVYGLLFVKLYFAFLFNSATDNNQLTFPHLSYLSKSRILSLGKAVNIQINYSGILRHCKRTWHVNPSFCG